MKIPPRPFEVRSTRKFSCRARLWASVSYCAIGIAACGPAPHLTRGAAPGIRALAEKQTAPLAQEQATLLDLHLLFKHPVGPRGLEASPELLALAGHRVRIEGYLVQEEDPAPGQFKLTVIPAALAEREDGPADDLPAATVFVHLPSDESQRTFHIEPSALTQRISVSGMLALGNVQEAQGRVSYIRLMLDHSSKEI